MGYYQINDGGKVVALGSSIKGADGQWRPATKDDYRNDTGKTTKLVDENGNQVDPHPVASHRYQEPRYKQKDREMTERARDYYGNGNRHSEALIERELWKQVGGKFQGEYNANIERQLWTANLRNDRDKVNKLSIELFNQVARASR